ncbi:MAG: hypothetical protein ABH879_10945 [archaeon]
MVTLFNALHEHNPDMRELTAIKAILLDHDGRDDEATGLYRKALEQLPTCPENKTFGYSGEYGYPINGLARLLHKAGRHEECRQALEEHAPKGDLPYMVVGQYAKGKYKIFQHVNNDREFSRNMLNSYRSLGLGG